jgi:hypothetical protein
VSELRDPPYLVVMFPLEQPPEVRAVAMYEGDYLRLRDWLWSTGIWPELCELVEKWEAA